MTDVEIFWTSSEQEVRDAAQTLSSAARRCNFNIPEEHLAELAEAYHSYPYLSSDNVFPSWDHYRDAAAGRGLVVKMSRLQDGVQSANVHFLGKTTEATPEAMVLQGITSLQSYLLLCESGAIKPPARFYGVTNERMAIIAHKAGFKALSPQPTGTNAGQLAIRVRYDTLLEAAFSPRIQRVANRLSSIVSKQRSDHKLF